MKYTSKQNFILNDQVDKRFLCLSILKDFKGKISYTHILAVVNLLIKEIKNELKNGNEIEIGNFGALSLMPTKPRKHWNFLIKKTQLSKGAAKMKIKISKTLKKELKKFFFGEKK